MGLCGEEVTERQMEGKKLWLVTSRNGKDMQHEASYLFSVSKGITTWTTRNVLFNNAVSC
jgi:hypothetical protein